MVFYHLLFQMQKKTVESQAGHYRVRVKKSRILPGPPSLSIPWQWKISLQQRKSHSFFSSLGNGLDFLLGFSSLKIEILSWRAEGSVGTSVELNSPFTLNPAHWCFGFICSSFRLEPGWCLQGGAVHNWQFLIIGAQQDDLWKKRTKLLASCTCCGRYSPVDTQWWKVFSVVMETAVIFGEQPLLNARLPCLFTVQSHVSGVFCLGFPIVVSFPKLRQ